MKSNVPLIDIVRPPGNSSENQVYHPPLRLFMPVLPFRTIKFRAPISIWRTYLVDEFIDEELDGFVKFVHKDDANPLLDRDNPFYRLLNSFASLNMCNISRWREPVRPSRYACRCFTMIVHYSQQLQPPPRLEAGSRSVEVELRALDSRR